MKPCQRCVRRKQSFKSFEKTANDVFRIIACVLFLTGSFVSGYYWVHIVKMTVVDSLRTQAVFMTLWSVLLIMTFSSWYFSLLRVNDEAEDEDL